MNDNKKYGFYDKNETRRQTSYALPNQDILFGEIIDHFLLQQKYQVKQSTYAHYVNLIDTHIRPQLGAIPAAGFTSGIIERYASEKLKNGKLDGQGGLSPKTVKDLLTLIRSIVKYGISKDILEPKVLFFSAPRVPKKEISIFSPEDLKKLEAFCLHEPDSMRLGVYLCLYTGLRIGELCALQWRDIDLEHACIHITKTILRISSTETTNKKTVVLIDTPKTGTSKRIIPLPSHLTRLLRQQQKATDQNNVYFLTGTLAYIEPRNYYNKYKGYLKECGILPYTFHTLRHTFATRCIEKGMDPKALSEILGHADVKTTLDKYVHPSLEYKRSCMELLSSI